jgi:branched-chain amino acid transport system permease protein
MLDRSPPARTRANPLAALFHLSLAPPPVSRTRTGLTLLVGAIVLGLLCALPWLVDALGVPGLLGLSTTILISAIAAASLNLALGYAGLISFGHAAFFGLGAYTVGILNAQFVAGEPLFGFIPGTNLLLITLPAAMIVSGIAAAAIGALSLRTAGVQFIMITLAFAQMLFFLFVSLKTYGGDDGLTVRRRNILGSLDLRDDMSFYFVCLGIAVAVYVVIALIMRSDFGFVLGGIRQNERRVTAVGFAPYPYKLTAFVLSGMGTGLAGALMANDLRFVSPDMMHWTKSGEFMIMVIFGGVGTLAGPWIGAAAYTLLETWLTSITENWQIVLGPVLVVVVLFTHGGLVGLRRFIARKRS